MGNIWKDKWYSDEPLSVTFPSLFALATFKDVWVADDQDVHSGRGGWAPCFSRALNAWKLGEVGLFLPRIQAKKVYS